MQLVHVNQHLRHSGHSPSTAVQLLLNVKILAYRKKISRLSGNGRV